MKINENNVANSKMWMIWKTFKWAGKILKRLEKNVTDLRSRISRPKKLVEMVSDTNFVKCLRPYGIIQTKIRLCGGKYNFLGRAIREKVGCLTQGWGCAISSNSGPFVYHYIGWMPRSCLLFCLLLCWGYLHIPHYLADWEISRAVLFWGVLVLQRSYNIYFVFIITIIIIININPMDQLLIQHIIELAKDQQKLMIKLHHGHNYLKILQ